ncbi:MAG: hypothetical protein J4224_02850 [Candidatus Diapherotrites archaeon]|uniref:Uncharacterized protein n=1 Tax=Candidatus Iainarchaeum sp. TaxID=3101447 RepID=A0A7J4IRY3_9ARCH|nr:MAG: hypothetical protein QT03_C0001G1167 [archaeon GW2011_AR10]MBS3059341.1 hypothetical protein [Candidatus Diapherotrites archaeon]HIH08212.1 hypothetical protein [Candidatus Diapherotrites archaeon]
MIKSLKNIVMLLFAMMVIAASFTLLVWLVQLQSVFLVDRVFSFANPLGLVAAVAVLVAGAFYLFKIGAFIMTNTFRF